MSPDTLSHRELGPVAVIGAGITGLTVANRLSATGRDVRIFEKSRAVGGRLATRRSAQGAFDHGTDAIRASSPDFVAFLKDAGAVEASRGQWTGRDGMRSMLSPVAQRVHVSTGVRVVDIASTGGRLRLKGANGAFLGDFASVVLTPPAPQAAALVSRCAGDLARALSEISMVPIWTAMAVFDTAVARGVLRPDCHLRQARSADGYRWVIQATPEYSKRHLETDGDIVAANLVDALAAALGRELPRCRHLVGHRWRFAFVETPAGTPFLEARDLPILAGGDWALGQSAEDGFRSGMALSEALLSREAASV